MGAPSRYEVLGELGSGGMGVVYKVRDQRSGEVRAMKTLGVSDPEYLLRLKDEFRAVVDLRHDNLVRLGELALEDGRWFFTMELVDGVPFTHWVRGTVEDHRSSDPSAATVPDVRVRSPRGAEPAIDGHCDEARLRAALRQLAIAVGVLHDAGRVHRDLKPSNVLVTDLGRVVVLDFGLATAPGRRQASDEAAGTVEYMAPEQARGEIAGPAADCYAIGVLLYECLTGTVPFDGAPLAILDAKTRTPPVPPSQRAPHVPTDLDDLCLDLLATDAAKRPNASAIAERLGRGLDPIAAPRTSAPPPFVGRARELASLEAAFDQARRGRAKVALLEGESGIGKTSIMRAFVAGVEARGAIVLAGRCHDREALPFRAFDGVVDDLSRLLKDRERAALLPPGAARLARLFPVLGRVDALAQAEESRDAPTPRELRARGFDLLRELLVRLGRAQPLVIAIDDLQWIDDDSLDLMVHVLAEPDSPAALLIGTLRPGAQALADRLAARGLAAPAIIPVRALDDDDARALARASGGTDLHASEAHGHPGYIRELVRATGTPSARGLEELLWARISILPPAQQRILEALCVATRRMPPGLLARAARVDSTRLDRDLAALRDHDLASAHGELFEPYHDRVRAAVLGHLPAEELRAGHKRLAVALEKTPGASLEDLHHHWLEAGRRSAAASYASKAAAQAAAALQFHRASELYRAAIELGEPLEPATRATLQIRLGDALAHAGLGGDAADQLLAAAQVVAPGLASELRRTAAEQLISIGDYRRGMEVLRGVLAEAGLEYHERRGALLFAIVRARARLKLRGLEPRARSEAPDPARDKLIAAALSASRSLGMVDVIRGSYYQSRFLRLALDGGEPAQLALGYALEAAYVALGGVRAEAAAEALVARAQAAAPDDAAMARLALAISRFMCGRFDDAIALGDHAAELASTAWDLRTARIVASWSCWFAGHLRRLATGVRGFLRDSDAAGDRYTSLQLRLGVNNGAWLVADDPAGALRAVDDALAGWPTEDVANTSYYATIARVNAMLYAGDDEVALACVTREWPTIARSLMLRVPFAEIAMRELRARAHLGVARASSGKARARSIAAARADATGLRKTRQPWVASSADLIDAGAAHLSGSDPRPHLASAIDAADRFGLALIATSARMARATLDGADASEPFVDEGVVAPAKLARVLCPAFF